MQQNFIVISVQGDIEMFKRKALEALKDWKENYAPKYAALLEGARRVGKSTIADKFAKQNYRSSLLSRNYKFGHCF